jgi:hypothetical protein
VVLESRQAGFVSVWASLEAQELRELGRRRAGGIDQWFATSSWNGWPKAKATNQSFGIDCSRKRSTTVKAPKSQPINAPSAIDDRSHKPGSHPRWRESYYFSFFDHSLRLGGFSSIGKRPGKGYAGSVNCLWGPAMSTAVAFEYGAIETHDDEYDVGGLRYRSNESFGTWELTYDGVLNDGGDQIECDHLALGPTAASRAPKVPVRFRLTFAPDYPPYSFPTNEQWSNLFDGHVVELGKVEGELELGGKSHIIRGRGAKDHSWGVRDWFKPTAWRWIDFVSQDGPEFALWRAQFNGQWISEGAMYCDGRVERITSYRESLSLAERLVKPRSAGIELQATAAGGKELAARGGVLRVVPMLFFRDAGGWRETAWNDCSLIQATDRAGSIAWANVQFESLLREPTAPRDGPRT